MNVTTNELIPISDNNGKKGVKKILKTIRKTGGYLATKSDDTPEEIMARALIVAQDTNKYLFYFGSLWNCSIFVTPNNSKVFFLRRARLSLTILAGLFFMPNCLYENTRLSFLRNISSSEKILLLFGDTGNDSRFSVYNCNAKQ